MPSAMPESVQHVGMRITLNFLRFCQHWTWDRHFQVSHSCITGLAFLRTQACNHATVAEEQGSCFFMVGRCLRAELLATYPEQAA